MNNVALKYLMFYICNGKGQRSVCVFYACVCVCARALRLFHWSIVAGGSCSHQCLCVGQPQLKDVNDFILCIKIMCLYREKTTHPHLPRTLQSPARIQRAKHALYIKWPLCVYDLFSMNVAHQCFANFSKTNNPAAPLPLSSSASA